MTPEAQAAAEAAAVRLGDEMSLAEARRAIKLLREEREAPFGLPD
jgi:hypothetical protein